MNNLKVQGTEKTINLNRLYKACPDLVNHVIVDSWFDDVGALVIKSNFTNEYGTQIYFTRLTF